MLSLKLTVLASSHLKDLFHPACLAHVVSGWPLFVAFSWSMKMAATKANQERTHARHVG